MNYKQFCNTEIIFASKVDLEHLLLSLDVNKIIFVMSQSSAIRWGMLPFIDQLTLKCKSTNGSFTWIKSFQANPTQEDIVEALNQTGGRDVDVIIAIGGGSCIDLAKVISAFHNLFRKHNLTADKLTDSIINNNYIDSEYIDIIAIPSTAGTGSELTQWATVWDKNNTKKYSIDNPKLKPKMAIIAPELTLSMSSQMTLSTGLDAICQAIESYWSKYTNPLVQEIAYRAIELIIENLRSAIDHPNDIKVRENLCKASVLAGLAFSQTRTTACHSISYPLTMLYGIPHGLAASITLEPVAKINKGHFPYDLELFELFRKYDGIRNWIDMVCDGVISMKLSTFNISEKDLTVIVDNSFTGGRMDNNPVALSKGDIFKILRSILY